VLTAKLTKRVQELARQVHKAATMNQLRAVKIISRTHKEREGRFVEFFSLKEALVPFTSAFGPLPVQGRECKICGCWVILKRKKGIRWVSLKLSVCPFCGHAAPEGRTTIAWEVGEQYFYVMNELHTQIAKPEKPPPDMPPEEAELYQADQGIREAEIEWKSEDD
jgi:hypothetical protein